MAVTLPSFLLDKPFLVLFCFLGLILPRLFHAIAPDFEQ